MKVTFQTVEVSISLALAEVASICDGRELVQRVHLGLAPTDVLSFTIRPDDVRALSLVYTAGNLLVRVPRTELEGWLTDERRSIKGAVFRPGAPSLHVRISKAYSDGTPSAHDIQGAGDTDEFRDDNTIEWHRDAIMEDFDPDPTDD